MTLSNLKMRISWDDSNRKEVENAKKYYQEARKQNRKVLDKEGDIVEFFHPSLRDIIISETELHEHEFSSRIIDDSGDRRIIWDSRDKEQVRDAFKIFNEYLEKGWRAYAVDSSGKKKKRVYSFKAAQEELYIDEKDKAISLKKFVNSFKKLEVLPKTYPG